MFKNISKNFKNISKIFKNILKILKKIQNFQKKLKFFLKFQKNLKKIFQKIDAEDFNDNKSFLAKSPFFRFFWGTR